jgi:RimJ/RimL family protein N-acetyltransferase
MRQHYRASKQVTKLIEIDTSRLRLRQWCSADREPFAALNSDPRVMEFFPALLSRAESDAIADRCQSLIAERGWGFWAVESKNTGEFIGFVGLHTPTDALPFSPCVEVGWRLDRKHWGKGYATEAARAALRVGFVQLTLSEIVSFTSVGNIRSRAVMERLGMLYTGETFEHPDVPVGNALRKHCLYRLSRELWQAIGA